MDLQEVMNQKVFAILGNTENPEKYAFQIKTAMKEAGYQVYAVPEALSSLNDISEDLDIIDLCIHPVKGLKLLQENRKPFRAVVIQPGAESPELISFLEEKHIPYLHGCLLQGLKKFPKV